MKTYFVKKQHHRKKWLLIDAKDQILGRFATQITHMLRGKNKYYFTPYINCGDNIIIINAEKIKITGKKSLQKIYYRHTNYPGGIKSTSYSSIIKSNQPEKILKIAITGMMPNKSPLAHQQLKNLYIYPTEHHKHVGQKPILTTITK